MRVLGVDPGSARVGIVARDTAQPTSFAAAVLGYELVERDDGEPLDRWLQRVVLAAQSCADDAVVTGAAVENTVAPRPYAAKGRPRITNPGPIIESAMVLGAVVARLSPVPVVVDPAGFGAPVASRRILEARYPPPLVGPRETTGAGKGPRQDLRAAFDLAGAAVVPIRVAQQTRRP